MLIIILEDGRVDGIILVFNNLYELNIIQKNWPKENYDEDISSDFRFPLLIPS